MYAIRVREDAQREAKILLGIIWSSVARYYLFMTSGSWGMWHHEIYEESWRRLPISDFGNTEAVARIIGAVDRLRGFEALGGIFAEASEDDEQALEQELDNAVFDLYGLMTPERDLIRDMCKYGLDLFYRHVNSDAVRPVYLSRLEDTHGASIGVSELAHLGELGEYIKAFIESWSRYIAPNEEFCWRIIEPSGTSGLLSVWFMLAYKGDPVSRHQIEDVTAWDDLVKTLDKDALEPVHTARVLIDGVTFVVAASDIVIIKRNERRHWTATRGREDAETTFLRWIRRQEIVEAYS